MVTDQSSPDPLLVTGMPRAEHRRREVVKAEGAWLTFADGRRLLDFHSQFSCIGIGHSHPKMNAALHAAIDGVDYVCELLDLEVRDKAASLLTEVTMEGSAHWGACRFVSSGSEAVEMALLTARAVMQRPVVVVSEESYHGWTAGASAATTLPRFRGVVDFDGETTLTPRPHEAYPAAPSPRGLTTDVEIRRCVERTEELIISLGIDNVAAFMFEIYHGAGGFRVPDLYVRLIREMTERLGILWIDDEAIAGAGRSGRWWAFQHTGVEPDILISAKGISASRVPTGVVVVSRSVADRLDERSWQTVSTNSGHPLSMAAIIATIETVVEEDILAHVTHEGRYMADRLAGIVEAHPSVRAHSGRGLGWTLEFVRNPATGELWVPADRSAQASQLSSADLVPSQIVESECEKRGVLLFTFLPNSLTMVPPLTISHADLVFGLDVLDEAICALDDYVIGDRRAAAHSQS